MIWSRRVQATIVLQTQLFRDNILDDRICAKIFYEKNMFLSEKWRARFY